MLPAFHYFLLPSSLGACYSPVMPYIKRSAEVPVASVAPVGKRVPRGDSSDSDAGCLHIPIGETTRIILQNISKRCLVLLPTYVTGGVGGCFLTWPLHSSLTTLQTLAREFMCFVRPHRPDMAISPHNASLMANYLTIILDATQVTVTTPVVAHALTIVFGTSHVMTPSLVEAVPPVAPSRASSPCPLIQRKQYLLSTNKSPMATSLPDSALLAVCVKASPTSAWYAAKLYAELSKQR